MADELESLLADLEGTASVSKPAAGRAPSALSRAPSSSSSASSLQVGDAAVDSEIDSLLANLSSGAPPPRAATTASAPAYSAAPSPSVATASSVQSSHHAKSPAYASSSTPSYSSSSSPAAAASTATAVDLDAEDALLDALISDLESGETMPTSSATGGASLRRMDSLDTVAAGRRGTVSVRTGRSELDSMLEDMQQAFTRYDQCAVGQAKEVQASKGVQEQLQESLLVLQSTRSRAQDVDAALRKVVGMAAEASTQSLFTNPNNVQPVLATLRSENTQHQLLAAVALLNMAVNIACRQTIGRLPDATLLVDLIDTSSPVVLQEKCVGCLLNLCAENVSNQQRFGASLVEAINRIFVPGMAETLVKQAFIAVANAAAVPSTQQALMNSPLPAKAAVLMKSPKFSEAATNLVSVMSVASPPLQERWLNTPLFPSLDTVLRRAQGDELYSALAAVVNFSGNERLVGAMLSAGLAATLIDTQLGGGARSSQHLLLALQALTNLALTDEGVQAVIAAGGAAPLVSLLKSGASVDQLRQTLLCITNLASLNVERRQLLEAGALPAVENILRSSPQLAGEAESARSNLTIYC